jgi:hypothetical protein
MQGLGDGRVEFSPFSSVDDAPSELLLTGVQLLVGGAIHTLDDTRR